MKFLPLVERKSLWISNPMFYYRSVENYFAWEKSYKSEKYQPFLDTEIWIYILQIQKKIEKKIPIWFENYQSDFKFGKVSSRMAVTVSNQDYHKAGIRSHEINGFIGMFCLEMPKTANERDGAIAFYDENDNETQIIKPNTSDLIIIPSNQKFQPLTCMTKRYRVLILFDYYLDPNW